MNDKQNKLNKLINIVVDCCTMDLGNGRKTVTIDDVLGKSRAENVVLTRAILIMLMHDAGYTTTTAAQLLNRSQAAIRNLQNMGYNALRTRQVFRDAYSEANIRRKSLDSQL